MNNTTRKEAEEAVKIILNYVGEDPEREGLIDTPARFVRALSEWFAGYKVDPKELLSTTFSEVEGYNEIVILRNIRIQLFILIYFIFYIHFFSDLIGDFFPLIYTL